MKRDPFIFTVTDLARFLGKSAVTIRTWERQGKIELPRDSGDNRKLTVDEVRKVAKIAFHLKRINRYRLDMIEAACTMLTLIERENE
jgi:predicted site-specific integrase-resolvase